MAVPTAGLVEFTIEQSIGSVNIANVFYFWDTTNSAIVSLSGLAAAFDTLIVQNMPPIQSTQLSYDRIIAKDVLGLVPDLEISPTPSIGILAGEVLASFNCAGFRLNPSTKETRPGQKRFAGPTESVITGNVFSGTYITALTTFAAFLDDPILLTQTYLPVIASRPTVPRPNWVVNEVLSATPNQFVTSQVSRKRQ